VEVIVPDANLLLYAYDDASPFHARASQWWAECLSGSEPVGLTHPVLFAFVRIATSSRAYLRPMALAEASTHVTSWLDRKVSRVLQPDAKHVEKVLSLLQEAASAGGNLVTDAQVAALAIAHRGTVHTADHDFARFAGLTCHFPLVS
jgi:toxin-antitoxin system PIN domain toxin